MADTPRLRTALQTIFADNNNQAITAQDIRDFLASVPLTTESSEYGTAAAHNTSEFAAADSPTFTGTPSGLGIPTYSILASDATTSSASFESTGLSIALAAGTYEFLAVLICESSETTSGCTYTMSGAGTIAGEITGTQSSKTIASLRLTAFDQDTGPWLTGLDPANTIIMQGITTISTPTNLLVKHLKIDTGISTVYAKSFLKVIRIS